MSLKKGILGDKWCIKTFLSNILAKFEGSFIFLSDQTFVVLLFFCAPSYVKIDLYIVKSAGNQSIVFDFISTYCSRILRDYMFPNENFKNYNPCFTLLQNYHGVNIKK